MAVVEEVKTIRAGAALNFGTSASGLAVTKTVNLGSINRSRYAANSGNEKVVAIVNALIPCLDHSLNAITKTVAYELYEE